MKQKRFISLVFGFSIAAQMAVSAHSAEPSKVISTAANTATIATASNTVKAIPFDRKLYTIEHKKFTLSNGLTLLVHEDHSVPVVGVNLWYHVGSRNEKRGKTGFAHLFEHFFFNGSENYPHGFREAMDDLGANNRNGTTNTDRTNFFEDVPVSALERTLYLESDRMGYLANYISKEMLERERGVVQNEKRQGENQPYGRVRNEISGKLYPYSHPYSWSTIGSMDDLNAASLDDIKDWYRTFYGPNNAVISLAGDITPERALALVNQYFGAIPPGPPLPRTEIWIPQLERNIRDEMQDHVPQVRVTRVYHAAAWKDRDVQYLGMFADALAGSRSARLTRRLVYDKAMATSVSASINEAELASTFSITVNVKAGVNPLDVEREIDFVMTELLDKGPTADEMARSKASGLANYSRSIERLGGFGGRSDLLAESMTYGGKPDAYLDSLEIMANAKPAEVKAAANKWLRAHHYTMTVTPFAKLTVAKSTLDRKVLPELSAPPDVGFPEIQRAKLKNGLNVVLLERHSAPIIDVALAIDAGTATDTQDKAGAASLTLDLLDKGSKTRNTFQISDALELLGAKMFTSSSLDMSFVRLQAMAGKLQPALEIMADTVLHPAFPAEQFTLQKQRRLAQIGQEKAQANSLAQRVLPGILFGKEHPYGKTASGTEKSVEGISRDDLVAWHSTWFKPGSATIVVTGDTTMEKTLAALEATFSQWQAGSAPGKKIENVGHTSGKKIYLIDKPDAPQSTIVAAHVTEPQGQAEDLALEPVMQNFGGMATSRLNRNLRLDKHWSYGTSGLVSSARNQRSFVVMAPVQTDKTKESMQEVAKEIADIAGKRPITGEEFNSIMRNMNSRLAGRFATLSALEAAAITSVNLHLPNDYWSSYASNVRKLNEQQLATAAQKFIRPEEVIWVVIGDLRKVEKGIRELAWGEVVILNPDGTIVK